MGTTNDLAAFATSLRYEDLPREVASKAKGVLIDSLGCLLGGYGLDSSKVFIDYAKEQGGRAEARVIGSDCAVGCVPATFANAELMNICDLDEVLLNWNHVATYVLPPALAIAERDGKTGAELVHALAVGYEVASRICSAMGGSIVINGTPPNLSAGSPALSGFSPNVFGAAAAVGVLLDFDTDQMSHAFGISGYNAPLLNSIKWSATPPVPMSKYGIAGWIAQTGLTGALLTKHGFTGDTTVLDGPHGYARMVGAARWQPEDVLADVGRRWWILETSYKHYPCCRFMHHGMDLVADLVRGNGIDPDDIARIHVGLVSRTAATSIFKTVTPRDAMDAQFSVPYVIAASAYGKHFFPDLLDEKTLTHPGVLRLASKVEAVAEPRQIQLRYDLYGNEAVGPLDRAPTSVEIVTNDGQHYKAYAEHAKGDPRQEDTRFSEQELNSKFLKCAQIVLSPERSAAALAMLSRIEEVENVRDLTAALSR